MTMNAEGMLALRGDQKVLQLGYKTLTYYVTHAVIFLTYSHATSTHIFIFCYRLFIPRK